jgi:hypothetical protein
VTSPEAGSNVTHVTRGVKVVYHSQTIDEKCQQTTNREAGIGLQVNIIFYSRGCLLTSEIDISLET